MDFSVLRLPRVEVATGWGKTTVYSRIGEGLFPPAISLGGTLVGWPSAEVDAVNAARIAGMNDSEIKSVVAKLVEDRKLMYKNWELIHGKRDTGDSTGAVIKTQFAASKMPTGSAK